MLNEVKIFKNKVIGKCLEYLFAPRRKAGVGEGTQWPSQA